MKRLSWILTLPLTAVAVVFAIANRDMTTLDLWPFEISLSLPLFVIVLVSLFLGLLLGGMAMWISAGSTRRRARTAERRAASAERDMARLVRERSQESAAPQPHGARPPELPAARGAKPARDEKTRLPATGT